MFNKILIYEYINKLTKNDITNFAINKHINLTNEEINIIYDSIKTKDILNNKELLLNELKDKLSNTTYNKILELYNEYKNKIS